MYENDTITAIATPPGVGALGIVRMSGRDSIDIAAKIFAAPASKKDVRECRGFSIHHGRVKDGEEIIDAEGNDLRVYNPGGGSGETYEVYVGNSPTEGWVFIGSALGNGQGDFDLNSVGVSQARYVKVVDLSTIPEGVFPGVEIDYIAALHSNHDPYADAVVSSSIVGDNNRATDPTQALGQ